MEKRFYYVKNGLRYGPVDGAQITNLLRRGQIDPDDLVFAEGGKEWVQARTLTFPPPPLPARSLPPPLDETPSVALPRGSGLGAVLLWPLRGLIAPWMALAWSLRLRAARRRLASAEREFFAARARLGEKVFASGLGSQSVHMQIGNLEERLAEQASLAPASEAMRQQDALYACLGDQFGNATTLPESFHSLQSEVRAAEHSFQHHRRELQKVRDASPARRGISTAAVLYGICMHAVFLGLIAFLLLPGAAPSGALTLTVKDAAPEHKDPDPVKKTLKELFRELAPSVPLVVVPGVSTGSGFLIEKDGRYLVVTNRHVIERATSGVEVHFFRNTAPAREDRLVVPAAETRVVAIHKEVDLALIDVTPAAARIKDYDIRSVRLAPPDHGPAVGESVFAIGHPGAGARDILTRTLTTGIVSAVHRRNPAFKGTFMQVTVPINPGNSGGPIFDEEGRVVGVATFIVGRSEKVVLEGLNFGLEIPYVHEVLEEPRKSLTPAEIAEVLRPAKGPVISRELLAAADVRIKEFLALGYRPASGDIKTSAVGFRIRPRSTFRFNLVGSKPRDELAVFIVSEGSKDVDLFVYNADGKKTTEDVRPDPDAEVRFASPAGGDYFLIVNNLDERDANGLMVMMLKRP